MKLTKTFTVLGASALVLGGALFITQNATASENRRMGWQDGAPLHQNLDESQLARLAQMRQLRQSGDWDGADAIRQELGLPERPQKGQGRGQYQGNCPFAQ